MLCTEVAVRSRYRLAQSPFPDHGVHEMYSKRIHVAWFGIHFFLITAVCLAGVFWLIAQGSTILPSACRRIRA